MKKDDKKNLEEQDENLVNETNEAAVKALKEKIETLKAQLEEKTKACEEHVDLLQRNAAEFDNFKRGHQ